MILAIITIYALAVTFLCVVVLGVLDDRNEENASLRDRLDAEKKAKVAAQHAANVNARWGR